MIVRPALGLGDPHFNSMRGCFFEPYTFRRPECALIRAHNERTSVFSGITYTGHIARFTSEKPGF